MGVFSWGGDDIGEWVTFDEITAVLPDFSLEYAGTPLDGEAEFDPVANGDDLATFVAERWQMTDADIVGVTRTSTSREPTVAVDDSLVVTEFALNGHHGYFSVLHLRGIEGSLRILDHHAYP